MSSTHPASDPVTSPVASRYPTTDHRCLDQRTVHTSALSNACGTPFVGPPPAHRLTPSPTPSLANPGSRHTWPLQIGSPQKAPKERQDGGRKRGRKGGALWLTGLSAFRWSKKLMMGLLFESPKERKAGRRKCYRKSLLMPVSRDNKVRHQVHGPWGFSLVFISLT